jgi:hypothetical protein
MLAVTGLVSLFCSGWGFVAWEWGAEARSHTVLALLFCLFPLLSIVAFWLYFLAPHVGVAASWIVLTGTYIALYLLHLQGCARGPCTAADSVRIAWYTLAGNRLLWLLAFVALSLMLDFTRAAARPNPAIPAAEPRPPDPQP